MSTNHFSGLLFGGLFLLSAACGCSVLEDRSDCPAYLDIDYRYVSAFAAENESLEKMEIVLFDEMLRWSASHTLAECPSAEEVRLAKSHPRAVVVLHDNPLREYLRDGTEIVCAPGSQIDALYVHSEELDCSGEEARLVVQPRKQFSTLVFTDADGGSRLRQYDLVVRGTTCGFDAADLSALDGSYVCPLSDAGEDGPLSVRIPRQKRSDLVLEFWDRKEGRKLFSSPVGLYLFDAGYDPAAPDLPDYELRIDFRSARLYLRVADWIDEFVYALYE